MKAPRPDYELPPPGMYSAVCYQVVDLGTHFDERWAKNQHLIRVVFEISRKMKDGRPFSINKRYTFSVHEKSKLRQDLESWRGRKFSEAEAAEFDVENVLGKHATINIAHSEDGKYANIVSINPPMDGVAKVAPINPLLSFFINKAEAFNQAAFDKLGDGTKRMINESREMSGGGRDDAEYPLNGEAPATSEPAASAEISDADESFIPF